MAGHSPRRRYRERMTVAMGVYVVGLFAAKYLTSRHLVDGMWVWVLALIPGLAIVGVLAAIALLIVEQEDEFIRWLLVRQTLIATAIALSISTVWGFLENFELVGHIDAYWIAVVWFLGFAVGGVVNRVTHGASGDGC